MRSRISLTCAFALLFATLGVAQYCTPQATGVPAVCGTLYESISNVTFGSINNNSGCVAAPAYEDYTSSVGPAVVVPGATYPISITIASYWSTDSVVVMFDSNQDTTFQASEILLNVAPSAVGSGAAPYTINSSITIPATANNGPTRLRVRLFYGTVTPGTEACGAYFYGNCEDYAVLVGGGAPQYQVNQPGAGFDVDGVTGGAYSLATDSKTFFSCAPGTSTVHFSSTNVGLPFDVGLTLGPTLSVTAGALVLPDGQIANINLADPTLGWLNNFTFTTPFPGNFSISFGYNFAVSIAAQQVNFDAAQALGISLSEPEQFNAINGGTPGPTAGPTGDDATNTYALASIPCAPASVSFYGAAFTTISVTTNGRVFLGASSDISWTPSVATSLTDSPFIGMHADLNQGLGGTITITTPAVGVLSVNYNGVPFYGTAIPNTYSVVFDTNTGFCSIQGLNTIGVYTANAFLGVSPGTLGATDPGAQVFSAPSGPNLVAGSYPMMYEFGVVNTLIPAGLTVLTFDTNSTGKVWAGS